MNQSVWSHSKNTTQLNPSMTRENQSLKRPKSKSKIPNMANKSYSENFLKQYNSRKSVNGSKDQRDRDRQDVTKSLNVKNKKVADNQILSMSKDQKKKTLILNALDKRIVKDSIKVKSLSHKSNLSFSNSFRYSKAQKDTQRTKSKNNLRMDYYPQKNKSYANITQSNNRLNSNKQDPQQKPTLKSISSTVKNEQFKHRVLNHLQSKNKQTSHSYLSLSQRKKVSDKIESKLNDLKITQEQEESFIKKQHYLSERLNVEKMARDTKAGDKQAARQYKQIGNNNVEIDERLQFKFAFRTRKGQHVNNPKKVNQDSILVKQNISKKDLHMIAVADGHGPSGHYVSQFVIKSLSKHFSEHINEFANLEDQKQTNPSTSPVQATLFIPKIYDKIQTQLSCAQINSATSGCTLVNVIIQKKQVLCANVGDSRAILARQMDKKNWELIYLSEDHKPQHQGERKRILKAGGRVHTFKGEHGQNLGPLRVWLPNQNIQGLAMTRSFGDNISKSVGVTHKPQMIKVKIDEKDKFILVASDGVWQFITNQQILQLIAPFYKQKKLQQACDALLKLSYERWTHDDDSVVDDISFVLVFLHC